MRGTAFDTEPGSLAAAKVGDASEGATDLFGCGLQSLRMKLLLAYNS